MTSESVIVALDFSFAHEAVDFARKLRGTVPALKVGFELFVAAGPNLIFDLTEMGYRVFLDLKFHDIPNTVERAIREAVRLGVWMLNVHALGGTAMMKAAARAATEEAAAASKPRPKVVAVTVLTSLDDDDVRELGVNGTVSSAVLRLAALAKASGLDGVICSPLETTAIREACGDDFLLVTPGVRPSWSQSNDQKRIMTPKKALESGSNYLVIGRPITAAPDPIEAVKRLFE